MAESNHVKSSGWRLGSCKISIVMKGSTNIMRQVCANGCVFIVNLANPMQDMPDQHQEQPHKQRPLLLVALRGPSPCLLCAPNVLQIR